MPGPMRRRRVGELIREEMAELLEHRVADPRLKAISLTDAELTGDLKECHIYVSSLGSEKERREVLTALERARGFLRRELAARLSLRHTPELIFHLDDSLERGARIEELLRKIEAEGE